MSPHSKPGHSASGYALLTALFVMTFLSIALALLAASLQIRMRLVRQESQTLELTALSDAALAETLYNLTYDRFFHGVEEHPLGGGRIASGVEFLAPGRYRVTATATHAGRRRTVQAEVVRTPQGARVVRWERVPDSRVPSSGSGGFPAPRPR